MSRFSRYAFKFLDLLVIFMMTFGSAMPVLADASPTGATVTTQLPDYPPGSAVLMTGAGWAAQEAVHIVVNDQVGNTWMLESNPDPVADDTGAFTYQFQLPDWFVATYLVTATGYTSGTATVTFTDLSIGTYDQCSNDTGTGYTSGDTGCRWINGNLQSNNSIYFEGDATVQRVWLTGFVPGSSHSIRLKYGTTKGGKHAYDFLTRWDWSESWITDADRCQGITGCETTSDAPGLAIPVDPNANGFDVAANLIKPRQFIMRGGTLNSASVPTIASGDYSGDSETVITVNFTVASSGDMCPTKGSDAGTCGVALWFGAHVAAQANWGLGLGAGSISGSPYHVALDAIDNASVGQRDNQMQANVVTFIPNGTIVIVKDAVPDDAQDFSFNLQNNPLTINQNFLLDDDSDPTLPNSQTFSVPPGTWIASELSIPTGWTLANLACTVTGTNGSSTTTDLANAKATITLKSNDTVTCTFTDTKNQGKNLTVTKTATPSFSRLDKWLIDKSVDQTTINIADGGTATFNYSVKVTPDGKTDSAWKVIGKITVANSNGFAMSGVNVSDAIDNGGTCSVTNGTNLTIPANGSVVLDYSCDYASAPITNTGTNTATATWTASDYYGTSGTASGTAGVDFSTVTPTETNKTITVVDDKTDPKNPVTLGTWNWGDGEHIFAYSLTKQGVAGTCTDYTNTAKISETGQSDSQKVTVCVAKDLTVSKTAAGTYNRAYQWQISKSVDQTQVNIADGGTATFNYTVKVTPSGYVNSGFVLGGTITINNPNDWEAITVNVADTLDKGGSCSITETAPYIVPKSGSLVLHYTCTTEGSTTKNTATVTWDKTAFFTPNASASADASVSFNVATETNKTITVIDDETDPAHPVTLGTSDYNDGPFEFKYSLDKQGVAGKCTTYNNTATIKETSQSASQSVIVCVGKDLTVTKTAAGTFDRTYLWQISKNVDKTSVNIADGGNYTFHYTINVEQTGVSDTGWALSGKITIANPNEWEDITLTSLGDAVDNGGTCTVDPGPYVVPKNGSLEVGYSCTYDTAPSSFSGTNTVTAKWDNAASYTPTDTATATTPFTLAQAGTTNKIVHVTDSYKGDLGTVTATDAAPFATATFNYDRTVSGVTGKCTTYDNTATITETNQIADKTVTLCVGADLTVTKTAAGTFDRTYLWKISKAVDKTSVNIADGTSYTFHYNVDVTQTGISDSGYTLSGKITITNPNDWEDIMLTGLTDVVDNGGVCTVDPTLPLVPKSGSVDVNYSCKYTTAPSSYTGINTASVTWNKDLAFTPTGSATATKDFTLSELGSTNKTVHVTDSYGGNLGTVTATDSAPFATASFTYDRTESGAGGTCTKYDNTATITETGATADKTVTLCVGKDLTISKTAETAFNRTYTWGINKAVDQTQINIADGGKATFNYTVNVTHDAGTDSSWTITGKITVSNPNDWEDIELLSLSESINYANCDIQWPSSYLVPKGGSIVVSYSCTSNGQTTQNSAGANWDNNLYATPTGYATTSVAISFSNPTIVDGSVTVTDSLGGNLGTVSYTDPSPKSFTYPYTFSGDPAGTCTDHNNTATFTTNDTDTTGSASQTAKVCVGKDLTVSKTAAGTFDREYKWDISKAVDKTSVNIAEGGNYTFTYVVEVAQQARVIDSGWTLAGKITLTNPNDWEDITLTSLADVVDNGGACTAAAGPYVVPKSGTLDVAYSCSYASAPSSYSGTNTVTANWDNAKYFTPTGSATNSVPFTLSQKGATNETVTVTDSYKGDLGTVTANDSSPYAKASFTYKRTESGVPGTCTNYDNTAKITETNQTASKTVTLCVAKNLTVTKTATPAFTRTFLWDIKKNVVGDSLVRQNSGDVTFNYSVLVSETGFMDSLWKVAGTITVTNPNDWEAITASIADTVDNGGTCLLSASSVTVPASGSKTVSYTCTWASKPSSYSGTNTVIATWDKALYFTPTGTTSGTAAFTFDDGTTDNPTNVYKTVTVTDTFRGTTQTLGTVTAVTTTPYTTKTFTYSYSVPVPAAACVSYTNTAKIVETGQTASQTITVCRPSLVTNSQLCTVPNNQWRLIFTPAVDQSQGYKLNASNPGQTYYNIFYTGAGNEDVTITLPYPYVTQGAVPIHVYSNVGVTTSGGITCLTPSGELANQSDQVTLSNYSPQAFGSTYKVTVHVPAVSGGFAYINIHLDYGLKGTTGYAKGGPSGNDAVSKIDTTKVLVPDLQQYIFSDTAGGSYTVSTTNVFKKNPGIGGKADKKLTDDPVAANTQVVIKDANKKVVATIYTDQDGWYMWSYKYTGKATTFYITISGITQSVTLKSNAYVEVDFVVP